VTLPEVEETELLNLNTVRRREITDVVFRVDQDEFTQDPALLSLQIDRDADDDDPLTRDDQFIEAPENLRQGTPQRTPSGVNISIPGLPGFTPDQGFPIPPEIGGIDSDTETFGGVIPIEFTPTGISPPQGLQVSTPTIKGPKAAKKGVIVDAVTIIESK
jgi:hypothetical protein